MVPVHFGTRERMLFGVYTPAATPRKRRGALLLNPWGFEALRAHRSLKHLGDTLAAAGLDVLRFDYFGTGDSFGDGVDVSLTGCVDDAEHALDELIGSAGVSRVCVIGLRYGGLVAGSLGARRPREINQIVFWDAVPSGADYLAELRLAPGAGEEAVAYRQGFPLSLRFREELADASLRGAPGTRAKVLVACSGARGDPEPLGLAAKHVDSLGVAGPQCWVEEQDFGAGAVPFELSRRIGEWVT